MITTGNITVVSLPIPPKLLAALAQEAANSGESLEACAIALMKKQMAQIETALEPQPEAVAS